MQIGRSNHTYKPLIEQLTYQNGIVDKVSFRYLELEQRPTPQFMWDIVVSDVVSPQGVLLSGGLEELAFLRFVSKTTTGVTCVPPLYGHFYISVSQIFFLSDIHSTDLNISTSICSLALWISFVFNDSISKISIP